MACKYGVQDIFWLCICWVRGTKRALEFVGLEREFRRPPPFMCRIYLVAYKFRFDFILWREPCAQRDSGCSVRQYTPRVNNVTSSTQQASSSTALLIAISALNNQKTDAALSLSYSSIGFFACIHEKPCIMAGQVPTSVRVPDKILMVQNKKGIEPIVASRKPGVS